VVNRGGLMVGFREPKICHFFERFLWKTLKVAAKIKATADPLRG
jgi:hypothetical protein